MQFVGELVNGGSPPPRLHQTPKWDQESGSDGPDTGFHQRWLAGGVPVSDVHEFVHDRAPVLGLVHSGIDPDMVAVRGGWDVIGWAVVNNSDVWCEVRENLLNHTHHNGRELGHDKLNLQPSQVVEMWTTMTVMTQP